MEIDVEDIWSYIGCVVVVVTFFGLLFWCIRYRQRIEQQYWQNLREHEKFLHDLYKDDDETK